MPSRRSRYDPLATSDRPRWLVVKDMHSAVLDSALIPAGTDLHALMAATIAGRQTEGWNVECDGAYGFFFCHRGSVREFVNVAHVDPAKPVVGAYPPHASSFTNDVTRKPSASA
jgi:hypothetical protein